MTSPTNTEPSPVLDTNIRSLKGRVGYFVAGIMILMSLVHLYQIGFGVFEATLERSLHLCFAVPLVFLATSWRKNRFVDRIPWYDWAFAILGVAAFAWVIYN
ncbi:MAG: hypothetical protein JW971_04345, partial [Synergistales bacterium]|nr:hypothetical protein [Synergistales bacterium]